MRVTNTQHETNNMIFDENTYCKTIDALLQKHFSISIDDTNLGKSSNRNIQHNVHAFEAVNAYAEDCDLVRTDIEGSYGVHSFIPLTANDELAAGGAL